MVENHLVLLHSLQKQMSIPLEFVYKISVMLMHSSQIESFSNIDMVAIANAMEINSFLLLQIEQLGLIYASLV